MQAYQRQYPTRITPRALIILEEWSNQLASVVHLSLIWLEVYFSDTIHLVSLMRSLIGAQISCDRQLRLRKSNYFPISQVGNFQRPASTTFYMAMHLARLLRLIDDSMNGSTCMEKGITPSEPGIQHDRGESGSWGAYTRVTCKLFFT